MVIRLLKIILPYKDNNKRKMIMNWIAKSVLPIIEKQESETQKLILESLKDAPAIYMS